MGVKRDLEHDMAWLFASGRCLQILNMANFHENKGQLRLESRPTLLLQLLHQGGSRGNGRMKADADLFLDFEQYQKSTETKNIHY